MIGQAAELEVALLGEGPEFFARSLDGHAWRE
jgi:hypothetical protein